MSRGWPIVRAVALVALGTAPGVALAGVVGVRYPVATAASVALAAVLVASLAVRHLARVGVVAALVAGAAAVAAVVTVVAPQPGERRGAFDALLDALARGWSTLLTSPVPADPSPRTLVPLALVVWSGTAAATVLAATAARSASPRPAVALVPVLASLVTASVVAGREQYRPVLLGLGVVVVATAFLASYRPRPAAGARLAGRAGARPPGRAVPAATVAAIATVAVACVAGLVIGPWLTFGREREPFDPRDRIDPPTVPSGAVSPLELFASRQLSPAEPMFVVRATEPVLTRLVVLDRYDGARWTSAAAYRPSGTVIEPPARPGVATRPISASITVDGLTGPWLPITGDPTRVEGVTFRIDQASGSLLASSGDALGAAYTVEALLPEADVALLQSLPAASDAEATAARELPPGVPPLLEEMARVATRGASTALLDAALLQDYLQRTFRRDDDYTAGHSYGHLSRALTVEGEGTEEQFASAFAVLGRIVGLPTRVVVGFGPGELQTDGTYRVRAGDARVWPEVKFDGAGWVPFDPSPARDDRTGAEVPIGPGGGDGFVIEEADAAVPLGETAPPPAPADDDTGRAWWSIALVVLAVIVLVGALAAAATIVAKRVRTARLRNAPDPADRVAGAWADVLDRLAEIDGDDPRTRTVDEVVEATGATTSALAGLYRPVLRALYDDGVCTDADAEQAWRARDRFVRACRHEAGSLRRAGWAIDPRPLAPQRRPFEYRRETPRQEAEMHRSST